MGQTKVDSGNMALVQLNAIEHALAQARSISEVIDIRNQAEAARQCFRLAEYGLEMQNNAAEVKLRAERKAGEMLQTMPKAPAGRPASFMENPSHDVRDSQEDILTYDELGIEYMQAHRWQLEAKVPQETSRKIPQEATSGRNCGFSPSDVNGHIRKQF